MYFSGFLTLALAAATASAQQQLAQLLSQTPELSTLNSLLATVPQVGQMLSTANGITILAPSNQAFDKFMRDHPDQAQMSNNPQAVTALLQYHVVMGMVMSNQLSAQPVFGQTLLNAPFANVTGGQRVELSLVDNRAMILSGYKQMSMVTTADVPFAGGVVHIVDTVLALTPDVSRQTQAPAFDGAPKSNQDPFTQGINPTTTIRPAMQTMRPNAAGHAAVPAAAVLGLFGGAVALANL
ncbi:Aldehyde dehydrogenase [Verticillium dahliae VDG1]|nr:Aldehyde dehydrogenase [Verticillium dahliae VDG1]